MPRRVLCPLSHRQVSHRRAWTGSRLEHSHGEFSGCRRQAIRDDLPFLELRETQLFAFELNDRYTLVTLQTVTAGHMVTLAMKRPYEECWPDFEAKIPEIALATGPAQMVDSRDAALRALQTCVEKLPEINPFAAQ